MRVGVAVGGGGPRASELVFVFGPQHERLREILHRRKVFAIIGSVGHMLLRSRRLAVATAGAATAAYLSTDRNSAPARFCRTLYNASVVAHDYKRGPCATLPKGSAEQKSALAETHERGAQRLLAVCLAHGGLYIKLGQFVASMNHVLPQQYPDKLQQCQDQATPVGFDAVRQSVEAELGCTLEAAFASFDEEPIAAASLAQVHRAVTTDGQQVAVKVQYPQLPSQVVADVRTMRLLGWLVGRLFPQHEYSWLLPEFESSITAELDFRTEADNAARTRASFAHMANVHVPHTLPDLSGRRVLTMEWIDGVKITDVDALRAAGLEPVELARLISVVFSAMAFSHGFVHCDPHPGNLLARPMGPSGGVQLVVLDHGMYRQLSEPFRLAYCQLWAALLTSDRAAGQAAARSLGVPDSDYDALSLVLTFRPAGSSQPIGQRLSAEARESLKKRYGGISAGDVNAFLERLPRDMLFVFRTWSLVRSLNRRLGGTTRQRLLVIAEYAAAGAREAEASGVGGARARWRRLRMRVRVHLVDYLGSAVLLLVRWWAMLRTAATSRTIADAPTLGTTLAALPGRNLG